MRELFRPRQRISSSRIMSQKFGAFKGPEDDYAYFLVRYLFKKLPEAALIQELETIANRTASSPLADRATTSDRIASPLPLIQQPETIANGTALSPLADRATTTGRIASPRPLIQQPETIANGTALSPLADRATTTGRIASPLPEQAAALRRHQAQSLSVCTKFLSGIPYPSSWEDSRFGLGLTMQSNNRIIRFLAGLSDSKDLCQPGLHSLVGQKRIGLYVQRGIGTINPAVVRRLRDLIFAHWCMLLCDLDVQGVMSLMSKHFGFSRSSVKRYFQGVRWALALSSALSDAGWKERAFEIHMLCTYHKVFFVATLIAIDGVSLSTYSMMASYGKSLNTAREKLSQHEYRAILKYEDGLIPFCAPCILRILTDFP